LQATIDRSRETTPIPVILIQIPINFPSDQSRMDFSVGTALREVILKKTSKLKKKSLARRRARDVQSMDSLEKRMP
jgi:hypothetical protein